MISNDYSLLVDLNYTYEAEMNEHQHGIENSRKSLGKSVRVCMWNSRKLAVKFLEWNAEMAEQINNIGKIVDTVWTQTLFIGPVFVVYDSLGSL